MPIAQPRSSPPKTSPSIATLCLLVCVAIAATSCGSRTPTSTFNANNRERVQTTRGRTRHVPPHPTTALPTTTVPENPAGPTGTALGSPLPTPAPLTPFATPSLPGEGSWSPAGRLVNGVPAVYETTLIPPSGTQPAGIAWMDTALLSARLYSGSMSPGGGPYRYTAPIQTAQATSLVAAFNGGFVMNVAGGGYYTDGRTIDPLVNGAASLVIYSNGTVNVGAWGSDVTMTPNVVSVRQNLLPLVAGGQPTPAASSPNWQAWGATCGATSCAPSVPGIENQWRSGVGITSNGALVYVTGPSLAPIQLAQLLVRAGAIRGMQMDINPDWDVFVTYDPPTPGAPAAPSNGTKLLPNTVQGPWTFFESWWARDFITMSARSSAPG
ncbi:MAG: phosphodiester glycosidase family protein [Actinobacteria bacterium]|nr:phosphodiester glycosidase family protein [Actinomycetota bacterium]MCL5444555.1 phosphodiester glycosidase family protein [Actinomycetota bacterium]